MTCADKEGKELLRGILDRIKEVEGLESDVDVARPLETKARNVSAWKDRCTIPWRLLLPYSRKRGLSLEWLVFGQGSRQLSDLAMEPGAIFQVTTDQDAVYRIGALVHEAVRECGGELTQERVEGLIRHLHRDQLGNPSTPLPYLKVLDLVRLAIAGE